jgi:SAM-dependent methyltransferase
MGEIIDKKELYSEWPNWADMKKYGPSSRWLRYLINILISKFINTSQIESVLDLGCGIGNITSMLATIFSKARVKGIDISESGIDYAKKEYILPNLSFEHDEKSKNLEKNYNLITCFEVLEHVEDWRSLLGRIADSSNKYLLISSPTGRMRSHESKIGHLRNFKKGEIEEFLNSYDYNLIKSYYAGFPFYSPIYRELCKITKGAHNVFAQGKYSIKQKIISDLLYFSFRFLSTKNYFGDQFCGLFIKKNKDIT